VPYGVDISEHNSVTPTGRDFYYIRVLSEYGRQDYRLDQHFNNAAGRPRGAYGIILPGAIDPNVYADRFIGGLYTYHFELVPTIDIELGDPAANQGYAAVLVNRLHAAGFPVVMGYYSAGSAYRQRCSYLFERQWLAAWNSGYPAGAHVHQYQGSPLDLDYCPDMGAIGASGGGDDVNQQEHDAIVQTRLVVQEADENAKNAVLLATQIDDRVKLILDHLGIAE